MRASAANADLDVGMRARETRERRRRDVQREIGRQPDREHAAAAFARRLDLGDAAPHRLERGLRAREKPAAGSRQADAAPAANEQLGAELLLEPTQARRER